MSWSSLKTQSQNWAKKEFPAPEGNGSGEEFEIAVSEGFNNTSSKENLDVLIEFDGRKPKIASDYQFSVHVEEQVGEGQWSTIASSFGKFMNGADGIDICKFIIQTRNPSDAGQPIDIAGGVKFYSNENPSDVMRVRVCGTKIRGTFGQDDLESVTLNGSYRLY